MIEYDIYCQYYQILFYNIYITNAFILWGRHTLSSLSFLCKSHPAGTVPHETAIAKDETNAEQAREILVESTLTAGAATVTEYEEHSENEISNKLSRH